MAGGQDDAPVCRGELCASGPGILRPMVVLVHGVTLSGKPETDGSHEPSSSLPRVMSYSNAFGTGGKLTVSVAGVRRPARETSNGIKPSDGAGESGSSR